MRDGWDWLCFAILLLYFAFLMMLASCARPLKDISSESTAKAAVDIQSHQAAKEETVATTTVDKRPKRVIHLRPDRTPWKIEEDAGELSYTATNSLKLLNSSLQLKAEAEASAKGAEIQKAPWSWQRVLAAIVGIALLAGVAGYGVFRVIRRW